jgi:hypothetical protein
LKGKQAWTFSPENFLGSSEAQNLVESAFRAADVMLLPREILRAGNAEDLMSRMKEVGRIIAARPSDSVA